MSDEAPKSAYELAMLRLRDQDRSAGIEEKVLTDKQRAAIAQVRQKYEAKLAEQQILHQSKLAKTADPVERDKLEEEYRQEHGHITAERDRKLKEQREKE